MNKRQRKKQAKKLVQAALEKIKAGKAEQLTAAEKEALYQYVSDQVTNAWDMIGLLIRKAFLALPRLMDQIAAALNDPNTRAEIEKHVNPAEIEKFLNDKRRIENAIKRTFNSGSRSA